ncbi:ABC transporter ATP-binding protein [Bacillus sp. JCM 19041]|uniref:ABC transporter ATP-binding protein n=1 Tax=Bacillus sp. JCM 19041 TaxID=1460637 RepID=UPI0006D2859A
MENGIVIRKLSKKYEDQIALENINLSIPQNCVYGILGRNGAGKTTLLECLVGLRDFQEGSINFENKGKSYELNEMKQKIGVQPQNYALFNRQSVLETLTLFSSFYSTPANISDLIVMLELDEIKGKQIKSLSAGQKQRVVIAIALVGNPDIVILDEPTTGIDIQVRELIWDIIKNLQKKGKTIIFTTHYMEEAEELCDQVAILNQSQIKYIGSPNALITAHATDDKKTLGSAFMNLTGKELRRGID